jgi:hypothetical protein
VLILAGENVSDEHHQQYACWLTTVLPTAYWLLQATRGRQQELPPGLMMKGVCAQVGTLREHLVWKVTRTLVLTDKDSSSSADATLNAQ